jgi:hypothetical protein
MPLAALSPFASFSLGITLAAELSYSRQGNKRWGIRALIERSAFGLYGTDMYVWAQGDRTSTTCQNMK